MHWSIGAAKRNNFACWNIVPRIVNGRKTPPYQIQPATRGELTVDYHSYCSSSAMPWTRHLSIKTLSTKQLIHVQGCGCARQFACWNAARASSRRSPSMSELPSWLYSTSARRASPSTDAILAAICRTAQLAAFVELNNRQLLA